MFLFPLSRFCFLVFSFVVLLVYPLIFGGAYTHIERYPVWEVWAALWWLSHPLFPVLILSLIHFLQLLSEYMPYIRLSCLAGVRVTRVVVHVPLRQNDVVSKICVLCVAHLSWSVVGKICVSCTARLLRDVVSKMCV